MKTRQLEYLASKIAGKLMDNELARREKDYEEINDIDSALYLLYESKERLIGRLRQKISIKYNELDNREDLARAYADFLIREELRDLEKGYLQLTGTPKRHTTNNNNYNRVSLRVVRKLLKIYNEKPRARKIDELITQQQVGGSGI
ncbi:MAG: hypothetical protein IIA87_05045 [Nanoarchaeota archaeon]|nr:hypothetical protein [Nanoarchaeota archaeon]